MAELYKTSSEFASANHFFTNNISKIVVSSARTRGADCESEVIQFDEGGNVPERFDGLLALKMTSDHIHWNIPIII